MTVIKENNFIGLKVDYLDYATGDISPYSIDKIECRYDALGNETLLITMSMLNRRDRPISNSSSPFTMEFSYLKTNE